MGKRIKGLRYIFSFILCLALTACSQNIGSDAIKTVDTKGEESFKRISEENADERIVKNSGRELTIGFSQVGEESDWRLASIRSVKEAFSNKNGYNLIYDNAQQKQENQIKAVREFIDQNVDYIIIDPITELGWENTLKEAREAQIPVVIVDRNVRVTEEGLLKAWIGSDFKLEGDKACAWLKSFLDNNKLIGRMNIAHIQGTIDSSAQLGRTAALDEALSKYNNWRLIARDSGDFTQAKGKEIMKKFLSRWGSEINIVFCENDNEAFGAIEAIEEYGRKVGKDIRKGEILVISFDSTRIGLKKTLEGKIALNVECNPDYGPSLTQIVMDIEEGKTVSKDLYLEENLFSTVDSIKDVRLESKTYPVTIVTKELIESRNY
ncbi:MAG: ABC transporter substrate-binding protein [Lachnospiraceae bacterium]|nr:ABC transporter substrate-binding protein [Lachnospiraceae bacterium]